MVATKQAHAPATPNGRIQTGIYAHIVGWGMAVPDHIMTNDDLSAIVETSDEWIQARTGIKERHIASEKESTATLGLKAAQQALEVADVLPTDLDLVICATSTSEHVFPSTASLIQDWLGATKAGAFDLSAACSGFVYGVEMAASAIRCGSIEKAVVIGAETMSRVMDWQDRGTCILFGDGAGAVVLQASDVEGGVLSGVLRSDGSGGDLLGIPTLGSLDIDGVTEISNGHKFGKMHMNGGEVFKFATRVIGESVSQAAKDAGITLQDLKLIVPHQANARLLHAAARGMKLNESIFMSNVDRYGNTSAASIPIALSEAVQDGRIQAGDYVAFVGFGGGLTWAAMIVKWGAPKPAPRSTSYINRQRRLFAYALARWRNRLVRLSRQFNRRYSDSSPSAPEKPPAKAERKPFD